MLENFGWGHLERTMQFFRIHWTETRIASKYSSIHKIDSHSKNWPGLRFIESLFEHFYVDEGFEKRILEGVTPDGVLGKNLSLT